MKLPNLYLASRSPRRRAILSDLGIKFELRDSAYDESPEDVIDLPVEEQPVKSASLKAAHAVEGLRDGIIIGADTIVTIDALVLGKPRDKADARQMLESLSGRAHKVITGLALLNIADNKTVTSAEITNVVFKKLSEREINEYVNSPEPYDKAGAYAIQGMASLFVRRIEGCYFNVVGFPVTAFAELLKCMNIDIMDYVGKAAKERI